MIETIINTYAKCNRFVAIKYYKKLDIIDKIIVRHHVY